MGQAEGVTPGVTPATRRARITALAWDDLLLNRRRGSGIRQLRLRPPAAAPSEEAKPAAVPAIIPPLTDRVLVSGPFSVKKKRRWLTLRRKAVSANSDRLGCIREVFYACTRIGSGSARSRSGRELTWQDGLERGSRR